MTAQSPKAAADAAWYAPGGWVAMVHGGTWLFAATQPAARVVERCWQAVRGGVDADQVVSAILHDGFRAVPEFALVHIGVDATDFVVRGTAAVDVVYADGTRSTIDAGGTPSLIERTVTEVPAALRLHGNESADAGVEAETAHTLPIESGVVLALILGFGVFAVDGQDDGAPNEPRQEVVTEHGPIGQEQALEEQPHRPPAAPAPPVPPDRPATQVAEAVSRNVSSVSVSDDSAEQVPDLDYIFQTTVIRGSSSGGPRSEPHAPTRLLDDGMDWMSVQNHTAQPADRPVIETFDPSAPSTVAPHPSVSETSRTAPAPAVAVVPASSAAGAAMPSAEPTWLMEPGRSDPEATVFRPAKRSAAADQPVIPTVRCPVGHMNDPAAVACRICQQRVPEQQPMLMPRPSLGLLRLSDGEPLPLDRGVIFGRNPEVPDGYTGPRPSLIRLSTADDISRNHVEIRLDGWRVLVVDLGSRNGTELTRPHGRSAYALQPLQEYELESGAVISLAPDVWIAYEVTS